MPTSELACNYPVGKCTCGQHARSLYCCHATEQQCSACGGTAYTAWTSLAWVAQIELGFTLITAKPAVLASKVTVKLLSLQVADFWPACGLRSGAQRLAVHVLHCLTERYCSSCMLHFAAMIFMLSMTVVLKMCRAALAIHKPGSVQGRPESLLYKLDRAKPGATARQLQTRQ